MSAAPRRFGIDRATRNLAVFALALADRALSFGYEIAKVNRRSSDWGRPHTSANAETYGAGDLPADSGHALVRDNPVAARGRQVVTARVVGRGLKPIADPRWLALWKRWAPNCYSANESPFERVQTMAMDACFEAGEVWARRRWRRVGDLGWDGLPLAVPLQIELYESDQVDRLKDGPAPGGGKYVQGVEYNAIGRPVAVWFFKSHPGDLWYTGNTLESAPVPYEDLAHLFREDRPGQARGVTWLATNGPQIRKMGIYEDTEQERKNYEACTVGVVTNENAEPRLGDTKGRLGPAVKDALGRVLERFAPGQILYPEPGYRIDWNTPQPTQGYSDFLKRKEHRIAQGWGVPYYSLSGDLADVNYSAARIGDVDTRSWVRPFQEQVLAGMFLSQIARWFTEAALMMPKGLRGTLVDWPVEWQLPAVEEHNRVEAVDADEREVRGGFTSRAERQRARGNDPAKLLDVIEAEARDLEKRKIKLDSDPNSTTRAGAIQTKQDAAPVA